MNRDHQKIVSRTRASLWIRELGLFALFLEAKTMISCSAKKKWSEKLLTLESNRTCAKCKKITKVRQKFPILTVTLSNHSWTFESLCKKPDPFRSSQLRNNFYWTTLYLISWMIHACPLGCSIEVCLILYLLLRKLYMRWERGPSYSRKNRIFEQMSDMISVWLYVIRPITGLEYTTCSYIYKVAQALSIYFIERCKKRKKFLYRNRDSSDSTQLWFFH